MARRGKNEGTIFRTPSGKWRVQISLGGRRIGHTSASRGECNDWLRKMLDQIGQGMTFESRNLLLGDYLDEWIKAKKNAVRANTGVQYERLIARYIKPKIGSVKLKDLTLRVINRFYAEVVSNGAGVSHIRYCHRVLHAGLEEAVRAGMIARNPAHGATLPKSPYKEMQSLNEQQVQQFLAAASGSRFKVLYQLAVTTGMRYSELRGLSWADVDWMKGAISVRRQIRDIPKLGAAAGEPKTRSGIRMILLGESSLSVLREQRQRVELERSVAGANWKETDLIFPSKTGTPFVTITVHDDFAKVLQAANLPKIRFHDLRHTAASLMLNHGIPVLVVSKILGHSNTAITLSTYAHSNVDMQADAVRLMEDLITPIPVSLEQLHPIAPEEKLRESGKTKIP